jgi:quercetin dioxygenase-like cupin family protein
MGCEKVSFASMAWESGAHPLERKKVVDGATLLEFDVGFADPNWCENGHAGLVLEGALALELGDRVIEVSAGEAFVVDAGTRHRAKNPGRVPVVLFVAPRI